MFTVIASCEIVEVVGISITTIQLLFCNCSSEKKYTKYRYTSIYFQTCNMKNSFT